MKTINQIEKGNKGGQKLELVLPTGVFLILIVLMICFCLHMDNTRQLINVTLTSKPPLSVDGVMSGTYQTAWGKWMNDTFYGHTDVVKVHNQIQYSLFHDGNGIWQLGKDQSIFSKDNIYTYAVGGRINLVTQEQFDEYAAQVATLQNKLESYGKDFVYILTPMKVDVYSDELPWYARVLVGKYRDTTNSNRDKFIQAFEKYGVRYYCLADDMKKMRQEESFDVFTKTGYHWTLSAVAKEMNTLFAGISPMTPHIDYPQVDVLGFTDGLDGGDKDAYDNENTYFGVLSDNYILPIISYSKYSDDDVFIFGTSMSGTILSTLSASGCNAFHQLIYQMYFTGQTTVNNDGSTYKAFQETDLPATMDLMEHIRESELVVMESLDDYGLFEPHKKFLEYANHNIDYLYYALGNNIITCTDDMAGVELSGFHPVESWGRWTKNTCEITLYGDRMKMRASDLALRMTMGSYAVDQEVEVSINGTSIGSLLVTPATAEYVITIPANLVREQENHIEFSLSEPLHSPKERGENEDVRYLGLGISSMTVEVKA